MLALESWSGRGGRARSTVNAARRPPWASRQGERLNSPALATAVRPNRAHSSFHHVTQAHRESSRSSRPGPEVPAVSHPVGTPTTSTPSHQQRHRIVIFGPVFLAAYAASHVQRPHEEVHPFESTRRQACADGAPLGWAQTVTSASQAVKLGRKPPAPPNFWGKSVRCRKLSVRLSRAALLST